LHEALKLFQRQELEQKKKQESLQSKEQNLNRREHQILILEKEWEEEQKVLQHRTEALHRRDQDAIVRESRIQACEAKIAFFNEKKNSRKLKVQEKGVQTLLDAKQVVQREAKEVSLLPEESKQFKVLLTIMHVLYLFVECARISF
jgi:uncharacterized protein (DUF3084 family)